MFIPRMQGCFNIRKLTLIHHMQIKEKNFKNIFTQTLFNKIKQLCMLFLKLYFQQMRNKRTFPWFDK